MATPPRSKGLDAKINDALRGEVKRLVGENTQAGLAERFGCSQGYISDFLNGNRGGGAVILRGLARVDSQRFLELLLGDVSAVGAEVTRAAEPLARSILRKRGWADEEIDAAKPKVTFLRARDAADGLAVADAWEQALLGPRQKPRALLPPAPKARKRRRPSGPPAAR